MQESSESLPILRLTERVATYMTMKFQAMIRREDIPIPVPKEWSLQLLIDCDLAVTVIAEAFENRGKRHVLSG